VVSSPVELLWSHRANFIGFRTQLLTAGPPPSASSAPLPRRSALSPIDKCKPRGRQMPTAAIAGPGHAAAGAFQERPLGGDRRAPLSSSSFHGHDVSAAGFSFTPRRLVIFPVECGGHEQLLAGGGCFSATPRCRSSRRPRCWRSVESGYFSVVAHFRAMGTHGAGSSELAVQGRPAGLVHFMVTPRPSAHMHPTGRQDPIVRIQPL
jgi:hypothetical protein